jgi:hypothetical protein
MGSKYTTEQIIDICKNHSLEFVDNEYIGSKKKYNLKCHCGNIFYTRLDRVISNDINNCGCLRKLQGSWKRLNLVGKTFGRLKVIEFAYIKFGQSHWRCVCECGNEKIISGGALKNGTIVSCSCYNKQLRYKGTKDISLTYFGKIKQGAVIRNLIFNITIEYIQNLLEKQNYKCALSGIEICGSRNPYDKICDTHKKQTASLDRIDSNKGYIEGNVQWTHKLVNIAKQNLSDKDFIQLCCTIADFYRSK